MRETEQDKTLKGLKIAIQMEIDGKDYYLKVSNNSKTEPGRKLLASLAVEEDLHRQKFEGIYDTMQKKGNWPITDYKPSESNKIRTIFSIESNKRKTGLTDNNSELSAVQLAMDMENKTYDYYKNQANFSTYDAEKRFYEKIAGEERGHYLALLDYYEYLKDPASWFVKGEHTSLDGG
jgi:rubrerythrin